MKRFVFSTILIGMALSTARAEGGRPLFYTNLEFLSAGNITDNLDGVKAEYVDDIESAGVFGGSSTTGDGALGVRAGLSIPVRRVPGLSLGGSVGFANGPDGHTKVFDIDPGNEGALGADIDNSYLRLLFEGTQSFALGGPIYLKFNAGAGVGQGRSKQHFFSEGSWSGDLSKTHSSTGFTWDAGSALVVAVGSADLELGFRYQQYPTIKESDETVKVKYGGFSVYGGVTF